MRLSMMAALAAGMLLCAGAAQATPGNNGGGNGGCGVGQQTNGCGGSPPASAEVSNVITLENVAQQRQDQAQKQMQLQAQTQLANGGAATSTSSSAGGSAVTGPSSAAIGDVSTGPAIASTGASSASTGSSGASIVDNHPRGPVNTAVAQGAAVSCRYGPGAGVQGITLGVSLALPVFKDRDCTTLAKAAAIAAYAGPEAAAQYLAARDAEINAAITQARRK